MHWFLPLLALILLTACDDSKTPPEPSPDAGTDAEPDAIDPPQALLFINEIAAAGDPDDWFELVNIGDAGVSLDGFSFSDDQEVPENIVLFPEGITVGPGEFVRIQFDDEFPGFGLGSEEELAVFDPVGVLVDSAAWPEGGSPESASFGRIPDGTGAFKTLLSPSPGAANVDNPGGSACGNGEQEGDEACDDGNQVPGDGCTALCEAESCGNGLREPGEQCDDGDTDPGDGCDGACRVEVTPGALVVNEIAASPDFGEDFVEIVNVSEGTVTLAGWSFSDDDPEQRFEFGEGVTLEPGGFVVVERGGDGFDFGLGGDDSVRLYDPEQTVVDVVDWADGQSPPGASWGRLPNGTGDFETLFRPTPGGPNAPNQDPVCGNEALEAGEFCDGVLLGGASCESLGLGGDGLACESDCGAFDIDACERPALRIAINEVASEMDQIEIINAGTEGVDLSGWTVTDDSGGQDTTSVAELGDVTIEPGGFLILTGGEDFEFGLGGDDAVLLRNGEGETVDVADWRRGEAETSFCRVPDGYGPFRVCDGASFGSENTP